MATRVFKIFCDDEIRRFSLPASEASSYNSLCAHIRNVYPRLAASPLRLQWTDEEGDVISVTNDVELNEALTEARGGVTRLRVVGATAAQPEAARQPSQPTVPSPAPAVAAAVPSTSPAQPAQREPQAAPAPVFEHLANFEKAAQQLFAGVVSGIQAVAESIQQQQQQQQQPQQQQQQQPSSGAARVSVPGFESAEQIEQVAKELFAGLVTGVQHVAQTVAESSREQPQSDKRCGEQPCRRQQEEDDVPFHPNVVCDGCDGAVLGSRFKCLQCDDFDLCFACESAGKHNQHLMVRIRTPDEASAQFLSNFHRPIYRYMAQLHDQRVPPQRRHWGGAYGRGRCFQGGWDIRRSRCPAAAEPEAEPEQQQQQQQQQQQAPSAPVASSEPQQPQPQPQPQPAPAPRVDDGFQYYEALYVLQGMGFTNEDLLKQLLNKHQGTVSAVVDEILRMVA